MGMGCNRNRGSLFEGYEAFWIIVVIAIVIIWVHYMCGGNCGCGCNNGNNCGCGGFDDCCNNNCCNSCC